MRVLHLVLGQAARAERVEAVLDTWAKDLPPGDALAVLGDGPLLEKLGPEKVWECVKAGGPDDVYAGLPRKMLAGLRRARERSDWDVLAKLDDDTLLLPTRMHAILDHHVDPAKPLYFGGTGFHDNTSAEWIAARKLPVFEFFYFAGGGGYFLTRPALEQSMAAIEQVMDAHGVEDGYLGAAVAHAKVPLLAKPELFRSFREPERLLWSCAATVHWLAPQDLRIFHRICADAAPLPFAIVDVELGWGMVGLDGMCGYQELEVRFGGARQRRAISAHAPSKLILRGAPGESLQLRGILNDSVPEGVVTSAQFTVAASDGSILKDFGEAKVGGPTEPARVVFPADGLLELRIATASAPHCHTVWLWES